MGLKLAVEVGNLLLLIEVDILAELVDQDSLRFLRCLRPSRVVRLLELFMRRRLTRERPHRGLLSNLVSVAAGRPLLLATRRRL